MLDTSLVSPAQPNISGRRWPALMVVLGHVAPVVMAVISVPLVHPVAMAQTQSYMLKPGSKVGPASKVKATNCVTNPVDNSTTCDTKIVNPPGDTLAKPQYTPFKN